MLLSKHYESLLPLVQQLDQLSLQSLSLIVSIFSVLGLNHGQLVFLNTFVQFNHHFVIASLLVILLWACVCFILRGVFRGLE